MKTGIDLSSGNFSHFRDGTSQEQIYTVSESAGGGNKLLEADHVETLMGRAFNLDGSVNQSSLAMFGKAYGEALSDRGFTLSSQHADELRHSENLSKFLGGSIGAGGNLGFASGRGEAGFRNSWDDSEGWSNTDSIHANKNLLLVQNLGAEAMEKAKTEYRDQNGTLPPSNSMEADKIYGRAADLFRGGFESLAKRSEAEAYRIPDRETKSESGTDESGTDVSGRNRRPQDNTSDMTWRPSSSGGRNA